MDTTKIIYKENKKAENKIQEFKQEDDLPFGMSQLFDDDKSDEEQEVHQLEPLDVIEKRAKVFASFSFNEIIDTYKFEHGTIYSF